MNTTHKEHSKTYNLPIYTVIQFITKQLTQADKLLYIYIYIIIFVFAFSHEMFRKTEQIC